MDVLCPGRVPAFRCITGKREDPVFSIRGINNVRNGFYLYCLFQYYGNRAVMAIEERRTYTLWRIMPVAFAIIKIATGNDCHQQHIDRYDQCKYFHNAGSNIGQSSDLFVMKDCNTVVSRKERRIDVAV